MPTLSAYGDAAPDLIATADNSIRLSNSIVDEQQNLDEFLVSSIGLADIGNEVIGGNRQALSDVLRVLVPTTSLLGLYHETLGCTIGGLVPFVKGIPQYSHILFNASITLGTERYRYPEDLPKVAATTVAAGRSARHSAYPRCRRLHGHRSSSLTSGPTPRSTGIRASLLNSDGLKQWLFGPITGPPRNTA